MNERETICILQVPIFNPANPIGGAEAIVTDLAINLISTYNVVVLHGYSEISNKGQIYQFGNNLLSVNAFPITDEICYKGEIDPDFSVESLDFIRECKALLSFERVLKNRLANLTITSLGGIGYSHCKEIAESNAWDYLIVPSQFVYRWVTSLKCPKVERVKLVSNGINLQKFKCSDHPHRRPLLSDVVTLLIPHRPDWEKGFKEGIDFAKKMRDIGFLVQLQCLEQNSFLDIGSFYRDLEFYAWSADIQLAIKPWVSRDNMQSLYVNSDLTLCLGKIPEGFGLTVIESIVSGTPVLAKKHGAVADILPPEHGLIYIEDLDLCQLQTKELRILLEKSYLDCYEKGTPYIEEKYSLEKMLQGYIHVISQST